MENKKQRQKLLYMAKVFARETYYNENTGVFCGLTTEDMSNKLAELGISLERKSFYTDVEILREFGFDIQMKKKGRYSYYFLKSYPDGLAVADLKLLADAVATSPFISDRKSNELVKKIESVAPYGRKSELKRYIYTDSKIKSMHSAPSNDIDTISMAINQKRTISFDLYGWGADGKLHKTGVFENVTPLEIIYGEGRFFLGCFCRKTDDIRFFAIDKIKDITIERNKSEMNECICAFDISQYKIVFGEVIKISNEKITVEFPVKYADKVFDRLGKDTEVEQDEDKFVVTFSGTVDDELKQWVKRCRGKIMQADE